MNNKLNATQMQLPSGTNIYEDKQKFCSSHKVEGMKLILVSTLLPPKRKKKIGI